MNEECKTIFFDLGNVLLFTDLEKMKQQIAEFCGLSLPTIKTAIDQLSEPYEKGDIETKDLHAHFCSLAGKHLEYNGLRHSVANIFVPSEIHFSFAYEQFPFLHLFDGYVLSYKVGARKPETKIFEKALQFANCSPNHCFYTDDIPEFVAAAKALNIDAELFTSATTLEEQLRSRNLVPSL
jgi:glucose-1-phosphatase